MNGKNGSLVSVAVGLVYVVCGRKIPGEGLSVSPLMECMRSQSALPPEYLCTSRVRLKIYCGIRPRLKTIECLCASGAVRQVILLHVNGCVPYGPPRSRIWEESP